MSRTKKAAEPTVAIGTNPDDAFNAMLGSNSSSTKDTKKKKSSAPVINLPKDLHNNFSNFLKYKLEKKAAETNMRSEESVILDYCRVIQDEQAIDGNFAPTYEVIGDENRSVKFITQDKHTLSQDPEVLKTIKEVLSDRYSEVIETKKTVRIKDEVFQSDELKTEFVKLIGDSFSKFFVTETEEVLKPGFNSKIYDLAEKNKEKLASIRELIPQAKPMFK